MKKIRVSLKDRSYDILIGSGLIKHSGRMLKKLGIGADAFIITSRPIARLYAKTLCNSLHRSGISTHLSYIPDGEKAKNTKTAFALIRSLSDFDKRKRPFVIALGGGVTGDIAGFVASVYKRGIPYVQIPTTLLAQVDSSIGGKVAIDLPVAKNLVGAFYQPRAVISDILTLKTLPARQVRNGLAEVIKYGVISDRPLFEFIEKNAARCASLDGKALEFIIARSAAIKARVVEKDELDRKGLRAVLNYGHTIGHAIESASGYRKSYSHGEAISVGMVAAARIAVLLGILEASHASRIEALLKKMGLPVRLKGISFRALRRSYIHDKKFIHGVNRFILPVKIGGVKVVEGVSDTAIKKTIEEIS